MRAAGVRCVVVHYGAPDRTARAVASLRESVDGAHVVVVDNDGRAGTVDGVDEVRRPARNVGFAGGAALGLQGASGIAVLANNDVVARPGWAESLLAAFDSPDVGAACPTVVFSRPMSLLEWSSEAGAGLVVESITAEDRVVQVARHQGLADPRRDRRAGRGLRALPTGRLATLARRGQPTSVTLRAAAPTQVDLSFDGRRRTVSVGPEPTAVDLGPAAPRTLVNSTGVALDVLGRGFDIDYLRPASTDKTAALVDRPLWQGGAVALRMEAVTAAGGFDPRLFMYSEDVDLGWRMARARWRTVWVPAAVVEHEHMATAGTDSDLHRRLALRNHLLTVARNAPAGEAVRLVARTAGGTAAGRLRDLADGDLDRRIPLSLLLADASALARALPLLPGSLARRRSDHLAHRSVRTLGHASTPAPGPGDPER